MKKIVIIFKLECLSKRYIVMSNIAIYQRIQSFTGVYNVVMTEPTSKDRKSMSKKILLNYEPNLRLD
jgi:hypothetical protein